MFILKQTGHAVGLAQTLDDREFPDIIRRGQIPHPHVGITVPCCTIERQIVQPFALFDAPL